MLTRCEGELTSSRGGGSSRSSIRIGLRQIREGHGLLPFARSAPPGTLLCPGSGGGRSVDWLSNFWLGERRAREMTTRHPPNSGCAVTGMGEGTRPTCLKSFICRQRPMSNPLVLCACPTVSSRAGCLLSSKRGRLGRLIPNAYELVCRVVGRVVGRVPLIVVVAAAAAGLLAPSLLAVLANASQLVLEAGGGCSLLARGTAPSPGTRRRRGARHR